ncbi:hypothetical protein H7X65_00055 [Candidatus Parcubacteria bacterium]|nr:hypothetical protein [Candidatus Parcubacteria bacterium]
MKNAKMYLLELTQTYTTKNMQDFLREVACGIKKSVELDEDQLQYVDHRVRHYDHQSLRVNYLSDPDRLNGFVTAINSMG